MDTTLNCPSCDRLVRVPDELLGRNVRCPGCKTTFIAEGPAPARQVARRPEPDPPDDEFDNDDVGDEQFEEYVEERPRKRKKRKRRSAVSSLVAAPAIALIVLGTLGVLVGLGYLGVSVMSGITPPPVPPGMRQRAAQDPGFDTGFKFGFYLGRFGPPLMTLVFGGLVLLGAIRMKQMGSYGLAMFSAILALLPCHCMCLFGVPIGIWALVVLSKPEVKDAFS